MRSSGNRSGLCDHSIGDCRRDSRIMRNLRQDNPNLTVWSKTTTVVLLILSAVVEEACCGPAAKSERISFVPFENVKVTDSFWNPRLQVNRKVTIPHNFAKCEEVGIIENFDRAAGVSKGKRIGLKNWDNFLYKTIEAASYSLMQQYNPELDTHLDKVISKIAAAQDQSGYLFTRNIIDDKAVRFSNLRGGLELYTCGHMYEAAVAHYKATGKRAFLGVATKNADLVSRLFGPHGNKGVPGHEEIELALVRLYEVTGDKKYLRLSKFFIDQRGNAQGHELYGPFHQDHKPFIQQREAVGQAPRATYLYSGAADIAYYDGDGDYIRALDALWDNVVQKKMYITGGIGSLHSNEGFGPAYDLPNLTAYTEICAAISFPMWAVRMFKLHGDAEFIDVMERTIYNNFLAGVSLSGDRYFYACPPESDGKYKFNLGWCPNNAKVPYKEPSATRKEWFPCACCPPNLARFLPQVPGFMYATKGDEIFINLFIESEGRIDLAGNTILITQHTKYPWDGTVVISVEMDRPEVFSVNVRIPGWAREMPVPGDLYRFLRPSDQSATLMVNGKSVPVELRRGYVELRRKWQGGDKIGLKLPMPIRRLVSHSNVEGNKGKVALQRGPVVYCAEGIDNNRRTLFIVLQDNDQLKAVFKDGFLGGCTVIETCATGLYPDGRAVKQRKQRFMSIPYCLWSNRGEGEMAVWLWRDIAAAQLKIRGL